MRAVAQGRFDPLYEFFVATQAPSFIESGTRSQIIQE